MWASGFSDSRHDDLDRRSHGRRCQLPQRWHNVRFLADDFILVEGDGTVSTKADLLKDAASGETKYEHQVDSERTIRVWGDTAVVTAKLWVKGLEDGKQVDYYLWFSDTYIRKPAGWSYVFGQASLALPK